MPDQPTRTREARPARASPEPDGVRAQPLSVGRLVVVLATGIAIALVGWGYTFSILCLPLLVVVVGRLAALPVSCKRSLPTGLTERVSARFVPNLVARRRDAALFRRLATLCRVGDVPCRQERVAILVYFLALAAGMKRRDRTLLATASTLHRTGLVFLPSIPAGDPVEAARHAAGIAVRLLDGPTPLHRVATEMARAHGERWDGTGSPCGLHGGDIPFPARLLQVALALDALLPRTGGRLEPTAPDPTVPDSTALAAICARLEVAAGSTLDPVLAVLPSHHLARLERLLASRSVPTCSGFRIPAGRSWKRMPASLPGARPMFTPA